MVGGKYRLKQEGELTKQRFSNLDCPHVGHTGPISVMLEAPNARSFKIAPRMDGKSVRKARFDNAELATFLVELLQEGRPRG